MAVGRCGHTATLLASGQVLVAGGYLAGVPATTAELYDPVAGTWTQTGSMASARVEHTATLLPSGRVLVTGGRRVVGAGSITNTTTESYDPATGAWELTGPLLRPRSNQTATLLASGQVLVVGGGAIGDPFAELYDPATRTWAATTGDSSTALSLHTATMLPSGLVLVAGGYEASAGGNGPSAHARLYDPATATWTATGDLFPRYLHAATLLPSGRVLVSGGLPPQESDPLYDPGTGTWSATGAPSWGRQGHALTLLPSGKVMVTGGDNFGYTLASTELYW
jgi:hypothetical protein